jgi:hypothetical protein
MVITTGTISVLWLRLNSRVLTTSHPVPRANDCATKWHRAVDRAWQIRCVGMDQRSAGQVCLRAPRPSAATATQRTRSLPGCACGPQKVAPSAPPTTGRPIAGDPGGQGAPEHGGAPGRIDSVREPPLQWVQISVFLRSPSSGHPCGHLPLACRHGDHHRQKQKRQGLAMHVQVERGIDAAVQHVLDHEVHAM